MALTLCDFSTTFQYAPSPKTFLFTDITDYAAQGVGLAEVTGILKVTDPTGAIHYNNTNFSAPDIDPDVSLTNSTTITLPLDGSGNVLQGSYTFLYTVRGSSGSISPAVDVSKTYTFVLGYASPEVDLVLTADCIQPLLQSTDATNYTQGTIDPTITRAHTLVYPEALAEANVTGTGLTLETNVFYTAKGSALTHSSGLTSTLNYTLATNIYLTDSVTGTVYADVSCDGELCDIYCCLTAEWNRYDTNKGVNNVKAEAHLANWHQMIGLTQQIRIALECGKSVNISSFVQRLEELGNCEPGCGCSDGEPVLVTGLGGGVNTFVVESGGTPIEVTSSLSGSTTTYTVSLASAFTTKVNNSYNTTVAATTGATVTLTTDDDGNKTYTVGLTDALINPDLLSFRAKLTLSSGSLPVIAISGISRSGTALGATPSIVGDESVVANWQSRNCSFVSNGLWASQGSKEYKAQIHIIDATSNLNIGAVDQMRAFLTASIYNDQGDTFQILILQEGGQVITGNLLDAFFKDITLSITLTA